MRLFPSNRDLEDATVQAIERRPVAERQDLIFELPVWSNKRRLPLSKYNTSYRFTVQETILNYYFPELFVTYSKFATGEQRRRKRTTSEANVDAEKTKARSWGIKRRY